MLFFFPFLLDELEICVVHLYHDNNLVWQLPRKTDNQSSCYKQVKYKSQVNKRRGKKRKKRASFHLPSLKCLTPNNENEKSYMLSLIFIFLGCTSLTSFLNTNMHSVILPPLWTLTLPSKKINKAYREKSC